MQSHKYPYPDTLPLQSMRYVGAILYGCPTRYSYQSGNIIDISMKTQPPKQFKLKEHTVHARMIYNPSVWQQLPYILAYPLKGYALPLLLIFSVVFYLLMPRSGAYSMLQLPAGIFFLSWTFKYAYAVLEHTALGYATSPMLTFNMWNFTNRKPLKQILFLAAVLILSASIQQLAGNVPGILVLALGLLVTPASAVIIATENSLLKALNPLKLLLLIKLMGSAYGLIVVLFSLPVLLIGMLNGLPLLVRIIGIMYLLIMTFHLLGFVVYHRREELGLQVSFSPEQESDAQQQAEQKQFNEVLDEVHQLAMGGRSEDAIAELFAKLPELGDTLETHQKLFARLSLWEDKSIALAQAKHYLTLLIQQKRLREANAIYQSCVELNPGFKPKNPFQILPLARYAYQQKHDSLALTLVQDFTSRYPNHPDTIAVQLLTAKLLGERFKRFDEAKAIMGQLLKYREHPLHTEIKKYAAFLVKYRKMND
jgi:tetratricopeptide (TPR) repeat protein